MRSGLVILIAYLLGSIPFGYLIVHLVNRGDVRETGSGGTGATNVSRRAGKGAGVLTLVLDALKGAAAVIIAKVILGLPTLIVLSFRQDDNNFASIENPYWWAAAAAIAVIVGHIFPVWLGFRGGKGVATGVGVFLVLAPGAVVITGVVFVVTVLFTRYVSLGSILAVITLPIVILIDNSLTPDPDFKPISFAAIACTTLILFAHRGNIGRLIQGTESRFK